MAKRELRVCVGVPSTGVWQERFGLSLANMLLAFNGRPVQGWSSQVIQVASVRGSILPKERAEIVKHARSMDATHVLFIDSDHTFPPNLVHRLLAHNKEIVALNFAVKRWPSSPTARGIPTERYPAGAPVFTTPYSPPLEKVWRIGFGCMLVNMTVFDVIGDHPFDIFWNDTIKDYQGEDWTFCTEAERFGFDLWVDHKLSLECGHIGQLTFTHEHVFSEEEAAALSEQLKKLVA